MLQRTSREEFFDLVGELLNCEEVKKLDEFSQHFNTSRLQHSINVSYCSYLICKWLNLDFKSAARAGMLHDLFLYDWREERQAEGAHAFAHPIVALRNAKKLIDINSIEADAIANHMWPITAKFPRYKESYVVTMADKICATYEFCNGLKVFLRESF